MPVFKEAELLAIGNDMKTRPGFRPQLEGLYDDDSIKRRFAMFNGIIRHVLPQQLSDLKRAQKERKVALENVNVAKYFMGGTIENKVVSHHAAIYEVPQADDGAYDFEEFELVPSSEDALNKLRDRLTQITLEDMILELRRYSLTGSNKFNMASSIFEKVVAMHLASPAGVKWEQRSSSSNSSSNSSSSSAEPASAPSTSPLRLKLVELRLKLVELEEGIVLPYAEMTPMVLYKSLNTGFPFCDMMYKVGKGEGDGKVVCIQVSTEAKTRVVTASAVANFCRRMGWIGQDEEPSKQHLALISFVYCPLPTLADKAKVTFEDGLEMKEYTVWHMNKDFSSGAWWLPSGATVTPSGAAIDLD
jgi:hypothetical protein